MLCDCHSFQEVISLSTLTVLWIEFTPSNNVNILYAATKMQISLEKLVLIMKGEILYFSGLMVLFAIAIYRVNILLCNRRQ